jgi:hypothetical protein
MHLERLVRFGDPAAPCRAAKGDEAGAPEAERAGDPEVG